MDDLKRLAKQFAGYFGKKKKTTGYDTSAIVKRIVGDTAYVHIPGGVPETPVKMTIDAKVGDKVQMRVANSTAWLVGNQTSPPTDDTKAIVAETIAEIADKSAKKAHVKAEDADVKATDAKETADAILVYDHVYSPDSVDENIIHFTAYLYQGGVDVKSKFSEEQFTWYIKTEEGEVYKGYGYTKDFNIDECGYGAEVIGKFTTTDDSELLTSDDDLLTNRNDEPYTVRASGDHIRINDLSVATTIFPTDKLLISGAEDEHLVTVQTLQDYLNLHLDKQILFNTTAGWNTQASLVSQADTIYIYTDYQWDSNDNPIAGIKVGDGNAYLIDLPFTDAIAMEHIADDVRHITSEERTFWNNKVRCYYAGTEQLVFTTA